MREETKANEANSRRQTHQKFIFNHVVETLENFCLFSEDFSVRFRNDCQVYQMFVIWFFFLISWNYFCRRWRLCKKSTNLQSITKYRMNFTSQNQSFFPQTSRWKMDLNSFLLVSRHHIHTSEIYIVRWKKLEVFTIFSSLLLIIN